MFFAPLRVPLRIKNIRSLPFPFPPPALRKDAHPCYTVLNIAEHRAATSPKHTRNGAAA